MRSALASALFLQACATAELPSVEYPDVLVVVPSAAENTDPTVELLAAREPEVAQRDAWDAQIAEARALYRDLDFEASLRVVDEALERWTPVVDDEADIERIHQLMLLRAMDELALGRADAARNALNDALALRPETELDEGRFPPDVRALHVELSTELGAEGRLDVSTAPEGARVLLDGRFVGNAPAQVTALRGHHHLRCEALGHATRRLRAEWSPGTMRSLTVELEPLHGDALLAHLASTNAETLRSTPASTIASVTQRIGGRVLVRLDRSDDDGYVAVVLDPDSATTRDLSVGATSQDAALAEIVEQLRPAPQRPPVDRRRRRRILGAIFAAIGVAGAAVAIGLVARPEPDPVLVWPQPER